jgi:hypothetical protein
LRRSSERHWPTKPWQQGSRAASPRCRTGLSACRIVPPSAASAKDVMVELDLKKITAPDFTVSIRPGLPALLVLDEARGAKHLLEAKGATS